MADMISSDPYGRTVTLARTSQLTGRRHVRTLPIEETQYVVGLFAWMAGALIQNAFPTLSPEDREFIKTGITPDEWDDVMDDVE